STLIRYPVRHVNRFNPDLPQCLVRKVDVSSLHVSRWWVDAIVPKYIDSYLGVVVRDVAGLGYAKAGVAEHPLSVGTSVDRNPQVECDGARRAPCSKILHRSNLDGQTAFLLRPLTATVGDA